MNIQVLNNKGIYTTTFFNERWVVLILLDQQDQVNEVTQKFPDEQSAKDFMNRHDPNLTFAENKAFMMALQAQQMMVKLSS
jgi:hypothetical protein